MKRGTVPELMFDIIEHAKGVAKYVDKLGASGPKDEDVLRAAIQWHLVVLGEISIRLGEPFHAEHPEIPWRRIIDQRNVIAHGYDGVKWNLIADLRQTHIPDLIEFAQNILSQYPPPPTTDETP